MPGALILAGHEHKEELGQRFIVGGNELSHYLAYTVRINTRLVHAGDFDPDRIIESIYDFLLETEGFGLLAYLGHGYEGGWGYYNKRYELRYEKIAAVLNDYVSFPLFILNDCCHAGSMIQELKQVAPQNCIGFLGASPSNEWAVPFYHQVLHDWKERKMFMPREHVLRKEFLHLLNSREEMVFDDDGNPVHRISLEDFRYPLVVKENKYIEDRPRWGQILDHLFFPKKD